LKKVRQTDDKDDIRSDEQIVMAYIVIICLNISFLLLNLSILNVYDTSQCCLLKSPV
jgi:hypothetical protein